MTILPAKGLLDGGVKLRENRCAADEEAQPATWLGCEQRYLKIKVLRHGSDTSKLQYAGIALLVTGSTPAKASRDSNGHLFVLLFFLFLSFVLRTELCLFLLFLLAFISFSLIAHIRFSLLEPTFPK